jgi:dUTP pyrophosphatase
MAVLPLVDELEVKLLHDHALAPTRAREGDAAYDLSCVEDFSLEPGAWAKVRTGIAIALPAGMAALVIPRSGLAAQHGVSVVNGPGLIDPNYRGEVCVVLVNLGTERFAGEAGHRVAQLLLVPFWSPALRVVDELPRAGDERGTNGFGSSGR